MALDRHPGGGANRGQPGAWRIEWAKEGMAGRTLWEGGWEDKDLISDWTRKDQYTQY